MWITFADPSRVSTVAILNTRGGRSGVPAAKRIRLAFYNGERLEREIDLTLKPFPWWTVMSLSPPIDQADRLLLNVIPSKHGGGLNEIKIYRD
jgi:hypothetical protein